MVYSKMSDEELLKLEGELEKKYREYLGLGLKLDISRGKPATAQLDISDGILEALKPGDCRSESGFDCRNYGLGDGLPEMKRFFSGFTGVPEKNIIVGGNSSLQLMYDAMVRCMLYGTVGSERPWCEVKGRKWLCVVPGYDRHFAITESLGFEMINVDMKEDGPDMDAVRRLVKDPDVKGIWCVPKYSNPTGNTYSDEVVRELASMECAAPDFRIFWDNAYAIHDLADKGDSLADIFAEAEKAGHEDRIFYFTSTSKVTYPGAGVAMIAASAANLALIKSIMNVQTIGYDKLNQLRHIRFFRDADAVSAHMRKHSEIMRSKFDAVLNGFAAIKDCGIAEWTNPRGGYFISLDVMDGCASEVYRLCKEAGLTLTGAGATFPYGRDPRDRNLRIAPTYCGEEEVGTAIGILVTVIKLVSVRHILADRKTA